MARAHVHQRYHRKVAERRSSNRRSKKVAPGTRLSRYRCFLPDLAGFTVSASPGTIKLGHASWVVCGAGGIRTLGTFRHTRFPIVHLRPLGHRSSKETSVTRRPSGNNLADGEGFEPWYLSAHTISNRAPSATRSPLLEGNFGDPKAIRKQSCGRG